MLLILNIQIDECKILSEVVKTEWCSSQTVTWASVARSRRGGLLFFLLLTLSMYTLGPLAIESEKMKCHFPTSTGPFCGKNNNSRGLPKKLATRPPVYLRVTDDRTHGMLARLISGLGVHSGGLHRICTSEPSCYTSSMYATSSSIKMIVCVKFKHHRCN